MSKFKMRLFKIRRIHRSCDLENKLQLARSVNCGLHSALRLTLFCGRLMGVVPLSGLTSPSSNNLRFELRSIYTVFYCGSIIGQALMFILSFYWILENKISLTNMTNLIFYSSGLMSFLILAAVSRRWPRLISKVEAIEEKLPPMCNRVSKLCNLTLSSILFAALVEHLLSIFYGITVAMACDSNNIAEAFFRADKPWIFTYTSYDLWKGIIIEILNCQLTFIWSYSDLLIMVISIYLTEHLKIHHKLMKTAMRQEQFHCYEFRVHHLLLVRLVKLINKTIGIYILNCFGSNLFWICTQLFFSMSKNHTGHFVPCELKHQDTHNFSVSFGFQFIYFVGIIMNPSKFLFLVHGMEHTIYFAYSFSFLVVRTMLVLLLAARVHSASTLPLLSLYRIPTPQFNVEVERYISQINNIKVALSGLDFFYVTRTMILTLLGTIITYELVMLQFINEK